MRRLWGIASAAVLGAAMAATLAAVLAGCTPNFQYSDLSFGDATGVYTSGSLRMVTERQRFQPQYGTDGQPVFLETLCTEPSPDYAIAFSQAAKATVDVEGKGGGTIAGASNEQVLALAGRSAGVLALRDGIYAACQSYANGVIGHDAYALILSQYGRELVELMRNSKVATPAESVAVAQIRARRQAMAALLVSCISEYDRTRIGGEDGGPKNPLLDPVTCQRVMRSASSIATGAR